MTDHAALIAEIVKRVKNQVMLADAKHPLQSVILLIGEWKEIAEALAAPSNPAPLNVLEALEQRHYGPTPSNPVCPTCGYARKVHVDVQSTGETFYIDCPECQPKESE